MIEFFFNHQLPQHVVYKLYSLYLYIFLFFIFHMHDIQTKQNRRDFTYNIQIYYRSASYIRGRRRKKKGCTAFPSPRVSSCFSLFSCQSYDMLHSRVNGKLASIILYIDINVARLHTYIYACENIFLTRCWVYVMNKTDVHLIDELIFECMVPISKLRSILDLIQYCYLQFKKLFPLFQVHFLLSLLVMFKMQNDFYRMLIIA